MTRRIVLNFGLAGIFLLLSDLSDGLGLLIGFMIGLFAISVYDLTAASSIYVVRLFRLVCFGIWFLYVLFKANLQIAWEIVTPGLGQTPRILRYPVEHLSDVQVTMFANCITLTPGTLVVDITENGDLLHVHCMYAADPRIAISELRSLDKRIQSEVFG